MSAEDQAEPSTLLPVIIHLCASGGQERRSAYFSTVRYALIGVYEILYSDDKTIKNVALIIYRYSGINYELVKYVKT